MPRLCASLWCSAPPPPPRRPFGLIFTLAATSALGLFLWHAGEKPKPPAPQVAVVVQTTPAPLMIPSPTPQPHKSQLVATRPAPSALLLPAVVREPEKAKHIEPEPEPVVTRVVIEADSTCTSAQPTEHITITGDASSIVAVTESPEVTL